MKILAVDQSITCSGYAVFKNKNVVDSGIITNIYGAEELTEKRIHYMTKEIMDLFYDEDCQAMFYENVYSGINRSTLIKLAMLLGSISYKCEERRILYDILAPGTWKKYIGVSGIRKVQKKKTIEKVKEIYGIQEVTEDEADAIGIGHYVVNNINIKNLEE